MAARAFGLETWLKNPCVECLLTLTFLGVGEVSETLLSQGHTYRWRMTNPVNGFGQSFLRLIIFDASSPDESDKCSTYVRKA